MQLTKPGDEHRDSYGAGEQTTTSELERVKRELPASLALSAPGSQARVLIVRHLEAVGAELGRRPGREGMSVMHAMAAVTEYTGVFPGQPGQVQRARREVARCLAGHPATDDAVLITSELASNAILHSGSKGQFFTVRTEIRAGYLWLEVEDLGGPWNLKPRDPARPHGLDVVEALAGPDNWGVDGDEGGRVVWCRLELEAQR